MEISRLAQAISAKLITPGDPKRPAVTRVYAGDRMSDLLNEVSDTTLLVTHLTNATLMRLIELMDAPAICLLKGLEPDDPTVEVAERHHAAILVSSEGMFETCGRLYQVLCGDELTAP